MSDFFIQHFYIIRLQGALLHLGLGFRFYQLKGCLDWQTHLAKVRKERMIFVSPLIPRHPPSFSILRSSSFFM